MQKMILVVAALLAFAFPSIAGEYSFSVREAGTGKPIILIPGLTCTGAVWDATVGQLKSKYHCYELTLPGFGGQTPISGPYLSHVRDDIIAFVKDKHLDHPAVIGHSLGGFMVFYLGCQEPNLFGPMISVDGLPFLPAVFNPTATVETSKDMAEGMAKGMLAANPDQFQSQIKQALISEITDAKTIDTIYTECKSSDQADVTEAMKEMMLTDLRGEISKIQSPILLIGAGQWVSTDDAREQLKKNYAAQIIKLPTCKLLFADKSKHFIMLDDPAFFYKTVGDFLAANSY